MPIYTVQGPDGKTYEIEGPAGATAEQLAQVITGASKPKVNVPEINADPTVGMSGTSKFLAGAGKAMTDVGRGVSQLFGQTSFNDVAESRKLDKALMNTGAGTIGNLVGNLAMFAPTAMIPGANTVTGAATIGAVGGLLQPSESFGEKAFSTGLGAAAGVAVPLTIAGAKTAKSFVEPFYEGGRKQIVGRALSKATGDNVDEVVKALSTNKSAVPGVQYTAAEASKNPGIAAMQRTATAIDPVAMNAQAARQAANNEARVAALSEVAGRDGKRELFEAARDKAADALYNKARKAGVDAAALTPEAQANIAAFQSRVPDDIIARAKELAKINGEVLDNTTSIQGMHWVKKALDSKISTAVRSGDNEMARAYTGLKSTLLDGLDQISPQYGEARRTYAAMSKPLTEMDVASKILERGTNPLTGNLQPNAYARALNDQTAAQVTGMPKATLNSTMTPQGLGVLGAVKDDLVAQNFAQTAGRGAGSDTVQKLAFTNMLDQAGIPTMMRNFGPAGIVGNVAQRAGQVAYKDANERMAQELARALMDPAQTAALMQSGMVTPGMAALVNGLRRSGTALGATAPALAQAQQ